MPRRTIVAGLLALGLAACGGSTPTATPSPSPAAPTVAPATTPSPEATVPSQASAEPTRTLIAVCDAVSLRKTPSVTGELVARAYLGTKVRVVQTVSGDAYPAGACGEGGDDWLEIDRVGGKSAQALYGVPFVYSAAGFYR